MSVSKPDHVENLLEHVGSQNQEPLELKSQVCEKIKTQLFKCKFCQTSFRDKDNFFRHLSTQNGNKQYACVICQRFCTFKSSTSRHMKTHKQEKAFQCKFCLEYFKERTAWIAHEMTHNGERPFKCEICKKDFARRKTFIQHLKSHVEPKLFECGICGKAFRVKKYVSQHMKTHKRQNSSESGNLEKSLSHNNKSIEQLKTDPGTGFHDNSVRYSRPTFLAYFSGPSTPANFNVPIISFSEYVQPTPDAILSLDSLYSEYTGITVESLHTST